MIKAVLLDLDDTLIATDTPNFFALYLRELGQYAVQRMPHLAPAERFIQQLMDSYLRTVAQYDPTRVLYERLLEDFSQVTGVEVAALAAVFDDFYAQRYGHLMPLINPRQETSALLAELVHRGYRLVLATNPGLPRTAIVQRLAAGGLAENQHEFELITSLETMHFGKPHPAYYAEILARLDLHPCEAIMVGNDWEDDIVGAAAAGLHTFWLTEEDTTPPSDDLLPSGSGSYAQFLQMVQCGWLDAVEPSHCKPVGLIARLAASPAAIDALCRPYPPEILERQPRDGREWSARDVVCHLRNHERHDRERLNRILKEHNPFLSAIRSHETDPDCVPLSFREALAAFVHERAQTVAWLEDVPIAVWDRPARDAIFGPTTFEEVVRFMLSHDRTHLHQIRDAIGQALAVYEEREGHAAQG